MSIFIGFRTVRLLGKRSISILVLSTVISCGPAPIKQSIPKKLQAPVGFYKSISFIANSPSTQCLQTPPFTTRLYFPSRYEGSGAARDRINPTADKAYRTQSKPIHDFSRKIASTANKLYSNKGSKAEYQCFVLSLNKWAQAGSLLNVADMTGIAVRKWTLAALASNYLKLSYLHQSNTLSEYANQRDTIEKWLSAIAWQVKTDYSEKLTPPNNVKNRAVLKPYQNMTYFDTLGKCFTRFY